MMPEDNQMENEIDDSSDPIEKIPNDGFEVSDLYSGFGENPYCRLKFRMSVIFDPQQMCWYPESTTGTGCDDTSGTG